MSDSELAIVVRNGFEESRHRGFAVAVDAAGDTVAQLGDSATQILPRSSLKPFQAVASLRAGAALSGASLAIAAGSHHASAAHLEAVRATLVAAGLVEGDLRCPAALPRDPAMLRSATVEERVYFNCSGKHAGMLAACVASGWDTASYLDPHHPYQLLAREVIEELAGPISATTVDGCGAPAHAVRVRDLAAGFGRLVSDPDGVRVAEAMRAHPVMVGAAGQEDTTLMELIPGVIAKGGAEGVMALGTPDGGGVAVKIADGNPRAAMMIALHLLGRLGVDLSPAAQLLELPVFGGGVPVGRIQPSAELARAAQL